LIFKESLRNIIKHAEAKKVEVRVEYDSSASTIRMSIKDDGNGFNESAKAEYGNGLQNMKKRAEEINAKLSVIKTTGGGTEIQLMVTLPK
jgi:signal transduction histidine kinase